MPDCLPLHGCWAEWSGLCAAQDHIDKIREDYERAWESGRVQERQMGVALYFIDKLALRAGHEKDDDEADTVGCCNLKVLTPGQPESA